MPELPEVETVVRQLGPLVTGASIREIRILDPRLAPPPASMSGQVVTSVTRSAKQIVLAFAGHDPSLWLSIHLRMTGRLRWQPRGEDPPAAGRPRAELRFDRGSLLFHDTRRLGTMVFTRDPSSLDPAGLDPLDPGFQVEWLAGRLRSGRQDIKSWLMRQDRLAGLGNIYCSEILFASGIGPRRVTDSLSRAEVRRLHASTVKILEDAIAHCGTTFSDFQDSSGRTGSHQQYLKVYRREGQPCPTCATQIERIVQQQRSTFFCPCCQPDPS